ncbi:hypothetical protein BIFGAL_04083 [Bifidobacterium gallicum DSM 20093 = LMG 11596]|uniref:Uncharacterized protein n=1 Tax=Bifidobacterium gallicum DSM 20093 = LMG 11596 TaxID=561180 RepID=D1NW38_9BIFI|nr:hypothetical protein BIFGAL_04083 [Bifidobacterium gallicum DSM 20093 = LMG 11596]
MRLFLPGWSGEMRFWGPKCVFPDQRGQRDYGFILQTASFRTGLARGVTFSGRELRLSVPAWSGEMHFRVGDAVFRVGRVVPGRIFMQSASFLTELVQPTATSVPQMHLSLPGWSGKLRFGTQNCIFPDQRGQWDYGFILQTASFRTRLVRGVTVWS